MHVLDLFRRYSILFLPLIAILLAVNIVQAHGGDTNLIHACVRNGTLLPGSANIRIVSASTNCNSNETSLDWNALGLPGSGAFVRNLSGAQFLPTISYHGESYPAHTDLRYRNFHNADMRNSVLEVAILDFSDFSGADLSGANLISTSAFGANFTNTNLSNVDFTSSTLQNTGQYTGSHSTNFTNANLTNVNFTQANLTGATGMSTATLTGVTWSNTYCPDGTNSDSNSGTCVGHL